VNGSLVCSPRNPAGRAPVLAVKKAKVAASYRVSDTIPAADSYVVEAVVEEPEPRDEEPVRARDSVTYDRDEYFLSNINSLEIEILMLESEMLFGTTNHLIKNHIG